MDFKIAWTDPAIAELGEIVRHIAQDNSIAARQLGMELLDRMQVAARFPQAGPLYTKAAPFDVRCLTHGNYRLYYRIKPETRVVEVVSVRHNARLQPQL